MPLRTLERAARRGHIERLLVAAALVQLAHFRGYLGLVAGLEAEHGAEYGRVHLLEYAAAVGELAVFVRHLVKPLIGQEVEHDTFHRILQFSAVGARVHTHAAADRAWDARRKLKPCQSVLLREGRELRQRHSGLRVYGSVRQEEHLREILGADYEQILQPLVRKQDIRAVAEQQRGDVMRFQQVAEL